MERKKIIQAGRLVKEIIYTPPRAYDDSSQRSLRRQMSATAQILLNAKNSTDKLELMLAANFQPGDIVATLTYDNDHVPGSRADSMASLKRFRAELNARRGGKAKVVWCNEHKHGAGRWHHHCVINSTGSDYDAIRSAWPYGEIVELTKLRADRQKNYASLARYMTKERPDTIGQRAWSYTRGLAHYDVDCFWVPDGQSVQAPDASIVLESEAIETSTGCLRYVKYLLHN